MWRFLVFILLALWDLKLPGMHFVIEALIYIVERQKIPVVARMFRTLNELEKLQARQLRFRRLCLFCVRSELVDEIEFEIAACRSAIARQKLERRRAGEEWTDEQAAELSADTNDLTWFYEQLLHLGEIDPISMFELYRERLDERTERKLRQFDRLHALWSDLALFV